MGWVCEDCVETEGAAARWWWPMPQPLIPGEKKGSISKLDLPPPPAPARGTHGGVAGPAPAQPASQMAVKHDNWAGSTKVLQAYCEQYSTAIALFIRYLRFLCSLVMHQEHPHPLLTSLQGTAERPA